MSKAILLDIDGTLLNSKKELTPRTKDALLKAQAQGCRLVLASGRPVNGLAGLAKDLKMDEYGGLLVAFNGGMVLDAKTGEVLFERAMRVEESQAVLEHMKKFDVVVLVDHGEYMFTNDVFKTIERDGKPFDVVEYEARSNRYRLCEIKDLAAFVDFPTHKILVAGTPSYLRAHAQEMAKPFDRKLNSMFTADFYYEFTAQGIDKAEALRQSLDKAGFAPKEAIAFGDAQNDASMLAWAGTGVAMGNAVPSLKAVADFVTASNDEDGIARYLEARVLKDGGSKIVEKPTDPAMMEA
ncbi:Cof-type HAD-IIB family hydrolase [uncultured Dubosiella sp.]|uniref:Cof-type HAD-IIB family hydrolase n=2 Tax=uncultured Dubosiella sp. TaxID=1937011 RepID=UPI002596BABC|nr:Cof-type HAD-IIB family hydrolase [uncultured Dubosiella sp.]